MYGIRDTVAYGADTLKLMASIAEDCGSGRVKEAARKLRKLDEHGNITIDINAPWCRGLPLICFAAYNGNVEVVKMLVVMGAKVDGLSYDFHHSPLYLACLNGRADVVSYLLYAGARLRACEGNNESHLYAACLSGNYDTVRAVLDSHGFEPCMIDSMTDNITRRSLLEIACEKRNASIVRVLLDRGANPNLERCVFLPLDMACLCWDETIVEMLIAAGADVRKTHCRISPFCYACAQGGILLIQAFLSAGCDVNARGERSAGFGFDAFRDSRDASTLDGLSPFEIACKRRRDAIAKMLLCAGGDVAMLDDESKAWLAKI